MALGRITTPNMPHITAAFLIDGSRIKSAPHATMVVRKSSKGGGVSIQPRIPSISSRRSGRNRRDTANQAAKLATVGGLVTAPF
jgi:hypothetical protein